uniref:Mannosyl-glycoprotein endo-beta-N-acetylglucosamidase-like domain-containing protein n=1 Tax=Thermosporothrix sp. COM3 TaxID=2490863 RepID=A0A455SY26_9CHLR|nr:hypothetical protein KTC_57560 [Thermosporothrix sp. COM3]
MQGMNMQTPKFTGDKIYPFLPGTPLPSPRKKSSGKTCLFLALGTLVAGLLLSCIGGIAFVSWGLPLLHRQEEPIVQDMPYVETVQGIPKDKVYEVMGPPTISVEMINKVLERNNSPAKGKGKALYDYGVQYGVDPAYALAFFFHESNFGTQGMAVETLSLGNIRSRPNEPEYKGYRKYATWEEGFEDWYKLIAETYVKDWQLRTVDQIIPVYAPKEDNNDEAAYILTVKLAVDKWRAESKALHVTPTPKAR